MTLGEKIRKYRTLNGLTQKELGTAVGFSKATADSRIRKYESNSMAPKNDMRQKIADALNIDLEAISDINIASYADIMHIFFELEEKLGMRLEKSHKKISLVFDTDNSDIATLISYLNIWKNQQTAFLSAGIDSTEQQRTDYEKWKSHFHSNVESYFASKKKELDDCYAPYIKELSSQYKFAEKTSDISRLLREIIESGISIDAITKYRAQCFTFVFNEILRPVNDSAARLVASFMLEYNHIIDLGADCCTEIQMLDKQLTITYSINIASFSPITDQTRMVNEFFKDKENQTDYMVDDFEMRYASDLALYYNNIKDEIELYGH